MARARRDHNPTTRQLTLDEWSGTREPAAAASDSTGEAVKQAEAKRIARSGVVSGRPPARPVENGFRAELATTPAAATLLTTQEATDLLRVHPRTIQTLVKRGELSLDPPRG